MSKYAIFYNKDNQSLVYYSCPKNANTSAKLFFAKHTDNENNFVFLSDKIPKYLQPKKIKGIGNLENFIPNYQPFAKVKADFKCCIIRDPIERFVSCYKNRILFHKDKAFNNYTIDEILVNLLKNNFDNRHFLPQVYFLGNDLNYYSFYSDMNNIKYFENNVNKFFGKNFMFSKLQTGGNKIDISLTVKQIDLIKKIYSKDYKLYNSRKK